MNEILNKVAQSSLKIFDLEENFPEDKIVSIDISKWLFEEYILIEKEFRNHLKETDWSIYKDKYVALYCSTDAILPAWTFALITVYLYSYASKIIQGNSETAIIDWYQNILDKKDYSEYQQKAIILKGCSKKEVPAQVYTYAIQKLIPIAKSIMFGEACSAVPLFKSTK